MVRRRPRPLGLPDWVAHRLWIGTIMLAAGTGVAWAARRLGLSVEAAIAAGLLYQLSPYLVPYVSRTSSMLLPWAGLGWIVGLTIGAATRTRWRDAALCALVIGTVGAVNTTALLMIAPAPVLWLRRRRRRAHGVRCVAAVAAAARIGGLALGDVGVVDGDAGDPGPPGRRPARLLGVARRRQPHGDVGRGVAVARLLADVRPRPVRPDDDRRGRLHDRSVDDRVRVRPRRRRPRRTWHWSASRRVASRSP